MLKVGDNAPLFTLSDEQGNSFHLTDRIGKGWTVVYFYPMDDTPGCTKEACSFRDMYEEFKDAGAEVVGISADSPEKHAKFIAKHNLPFVLLCDERKEVSKSYGVKGSLFGLLPGRETFVIDEQGVIRHIFRSQFKAEQHVEEAVSIIRGLKS